MKKALKFLAKLTLPVMIALNSVNAEDKISAKLESNSGVAGRVLQPPKKESTFKLADIIDRITISASYSASLDADPMKDFYSKMNEDFLDPGKYLSTLTPTKEQWKTIQSPNSISSSGGELEFRLFGDKNMNFYLTGAYETAKVNAPRYNEVYVRNFWDDPIGIERTEEFNLTKQSIHAGISKNIIKNLSMNVSGGIDFYDIKGNSDMTILIRGPPITNNTYQERHSIDYNGTGQGTSVELGADWNFWKSFSLGISGDIKWGEVKTNGEEMITDNWGGYMNNDKYIAPSINFNNSSIKGKIKYKFSYPEKQQKEQELKLKFK